MSHGVKRQRESPEKEAARRAKEKTQVEEYLSLTKDIMTRRSNNDYSQSAFDMTTTLLKKNPEFYTLWNYRRKILLQGIFVENPDQKRPILLAELQFLFLRLRQYPKCYWIWLYRKWCLEVCPDADWDNELKLVSRMLEADARNYHGWGYRRYVVSNIEKTRGLSLASGEFHYTTTKTNNISNFSAWHNRVNLIPHLLSSDNTANFDQQRKIFFDTELKRTHNGLWVDPDDQSVWLYHSWLLGEPFSLHHKLEVKPILAPTSTDEKVSVLQSELQMLEELLKEVPDSKWCLHSISQYKISLARLLQVDVHEEVAEMITKLEQKDPMRSGRYQEWRRSYLLADPTVSAQ